MTAMHTHSAVESIQEKGIRFLAITGGADGFNLDTRRRKVVGCGGRDAAIAAITNFPANATFQNDVLLHRLDLAWRWLVEHASG